MFAMKIALGSDHAGFAYKEKAKALLLSLGHEVKDFGTDSEKPVPYPEYIRPAAQAVASGECERAIVFGGSGNGEAMVANKVKGVRCAYAWNSQTAELGRTSQRRQRDGDRPADDFGIYRAGAGADFPPDPVRGRPAYRAHSRDRMSVFFVLNSLNSYPK